MSLLFYSFVLCHSLLFKFYTAKDMHLFLICYFRLALSLTKGVLFIRCEIKSAAEVFANIRLSEVNLSDTDI